MKKERTKLLTIDLKIFRLLFSLKEDRDKFCINSYIFAMADIFAGIARVSMLQNRRFPLDEA
jgi:hypothetical protein